MSLRSVLEAASQQQPQQLAHLFELLRIPSVSTGADHAPDMERAADWLLRRMQAIGLQRVHLIPTAGHPVVYGEWLAGGAQLPTVLIYGHYDVQPVDPEDEWHSPPFEPTVRDGYLYGRGSSDDKGQFYAHLAAVEAFVRTRGGPPINLKFFLEGDEECGSPGLEPAIQQNAGELACDAVVISDGSFFNAQTPAIGTGVRGLTYMEIEVRGPQHDLHSGSYGGAVHNPLQAAVEMLAALHDEHGRVAIPGFYDRVRSLSDAERSALRQVPFDEAQFLRDEVGAPALWSGEAGYTVLERITARPTLEIHGIRGGFVADGQKTVIPASAVCKVSMRLVPDQQPAEIARLFEQRIRQLAPPTVQVVVRAMSYADAAVVDVNSPAIQAAVVAYRQGFEAEPIFMRSGGTLPVVPYFNRILKAPVVLMSFGLPDDNLHAPNEKYKLEHFYRSINTSIIFMEEMASRKP